jgi:hypothetical protein
MPRPLTAALSYALTTISVLAASQLIQSAKPLPALEATGEVISESFHTDSDHNAFSVQAKIRIHVRNLTTEKLIVPKDVGFLYVFDLARDAKSLAAGLTESQFHGGDVTIGTFKVVPPAVNPLMSPLDVVSLPQSTVVEVTLDPDDLETVTENGTRIPNAAFVILNPGESFENVMKFGDLDVQCGDKGKIHSGSHVLQLGVGGWFYPTINAKEMATRWEKIGRLIYESFRTEPISFDIPSDPDTHPCAKPPA